MAKERTNKFKKPQKAEKNKKSSQLIESTYNKEFLASH